MKIDFEKKLCKSIYFSVSLCALVIICLVCIFQHIDDYHKTGGNWQINIHVIEEILQTYSSYFWNSFMTGLLYSGPVYNFTVLQSNLWQNCKS